jgi:ABC-2 type transport system ATP-binding protein
MRGHQFVPQLIEALPAMFDSVSVGKPTLEDVFIHVTGHAFKDQQRNSPNPRPAAAKR